MTLSRSRLLAGLTAAALLPLGAGTASAAPAFDPQMVSALAAELGVSAREATDRLLTQADQQGKLTQLQGAGAVDGAFFDAAGRLVVNATSDAGAAKAAELGLTARRAAKGESGLLAIKRELDGVAAAGVPVGVTSWQTDLATDTVTVRVSDSSRPEAQALLAAARRHGGAVRVEHDSTPLAAHISVSPGAKMTFSASGGGYCSVGFGARDAAGTRYLVSAGHCLRDSRPLYSGTTVFGTTTDTRFAQGQASVDMGIARIDAEDSIATSVYTHGSSAGSPVVRGATRTAVGGALCKSGATSGWTCGTVRSYDVSVTYTDPNGGPSTTVTGLGSSTVCTMPGDSGGAYISGDQAQGMTSGGPIGQQCTFNGGAQSGKSSYFQPLTDALSHYRLTLTTS
ncbi:S1 family peptidase [Allokutzneria albata]|uniref:Trypsin n=1 Tax=Allokutzneria albata TaxID=211114 RepID=A0A1H0DD60_ALLAB|nr:S1 family peptidase [Allokutzneria albata]SDN68090.1 Trypsin [Allokutzneria albata]